MAKWERSDYGVRRLDGSFVTDLYVKHSFTVGRVVVVVSRSIVPGRIGEWLMTCWPWAEGMPLDAKPEDEAGAKKEALEWVRQKFVAAVTEIKWSQG